MPRFDQLFTLPLALPIALSKMRSRRAAASTIAANTASTMLRLGLLMAFAGSNSFGRCRRAMSPCHAASMTRGEGACEQGALQAR